ncbi:hypothetical protein HUU59_10875 [bacterium]|nr:hypothetical protein [bacterium]
MKKIFQWVWQRLDGKKLWSTICTILGYQLAQLVQMYPDCLPIPQQIPIIGGWCVPWDWILPLLATLGIGIGGGHKIIKRVQKNGALFMLLTFLLVTPAIAQPSVHYYIGERINVLEGVRPGLTRELITKAAAAGCDGIVGLDQWSKNGDPRADARWRDSMHVMCRLCDSLGLELRPLVWNGSKYHYGYPDFIETTAPVGLAETFWKAYTILPGQREFLFFDLPEQFTRRLFNLEIEVSGAPANIQFFRDTPGQELVAKYTAQPGQRSLTFHSLENSTGWFIYLSPSGSTPTRIFVRGLSERAPTVTEAPAYTGAQAQYRYYGHDGQTGFYLARTMNPDCTAAFYGIAMRQSLLFWQEFQNEPAIAGVWFSLDEVALLGQHEYDRAPNAGEAFAQLVADAAWFNYSLWGKESWGWNDCLGGHNSTTFTRASFGMENEGVTDGTPFLGFAWNESRPNALRAELARFDTGSVAAAVYLGTNNIDSAAVAVRDYEVQQVILFNWQYQTWIDSLAAIVPKFKR